MDSANKQYYKEQLIEYLRSTPRYRRANDQVIDSLVKSIEVDLLAIIQANVNSSIQDIYDFLDKDALDNLKNETNPGRNLANANKQSNGTLRDMIGLYRTFLDSKSHPLSEKEKKRRRKATGKEGGSKQTPEPAPSSSESTTAPSEPNSSSNEPTPSSPKPSPSKPHVPEPESYGKMEGAKSTEIVTKYERDPANRKACIAYYGYVCQVCGMDFVKTYGDLGKNFIEVHHRYPVSQGERKVDPIIHLVPLCSNCHSMIHRQNDVADWRGLRDKYLDIKAQREVNAEESK